MSLISTKTTEAIAFALSAHEGQLRKGDNRPYIIHPLSVGFILQGAGYSEDVVIAGILHDVIEDTKYTKEDISEKFGSKVADLVVGVTEDKSIKDWEAKMDNYLENLKNSNDEIKAISAADALDNRRSILWNIENGFDIWSKFKASPEKVIQKTEERLEIVKSLNNEIIFELQEIIPKLRASIK